MILDAYKGNLGGKAAGSLQSVSRISRERNGLVDLVLGGLCHLLADDTLLEIIRPPSFWVRVGWVRLFAENSKGYVNDPQPHL